jgi:radical SAM-linked protein
MVQRVRIRFCKQGDLRLCSHRDLMRTVERVLRRAGIAVCESEGFHPKPRVHYPASLALGMTGLDEVLEADLAEGIEPSALLAQLNAHTVPGLVFNSVEVLPTQGKKGQPRWLRFDVLLTGDRVQTLQEHVASFLAASTWKIDRENKPVDIRPLVEELSLVGDILSMRLRVVQDAGARPRDVLQALGFSADEILELEISRTEVQMAHS